MRSPVSLVWSRILSPFPLPVEQVGAWLTRLAAESSGWPVVLELRTDEDGLHHLLGCEPERVHAIRKMLTDLVPGSHLVGLDGYTRKTVRAAGRITARPAELPLRVDSPEAVVRALYSALHHRHKDADTSVIQVVIGAGTAPRTVPPAVPDPMPMTMWQALTEGPQKATTETRTRLKEKAGQYQLGCVLRVGVTADTSDKRTRRIRELASAVRVAASPGVDLRLKKEEPNALNVWPVPARFPLRLSVAELVPFTGLPLGDQQLPGMPPIHPRPLRADADVHTRSHVFARALAPGDTRRLGVAPADWCLHGLAVGGTGVGKTNALLTIAAARIADGSPVVVLDPKAQMDLLSYIPKHRMKDVVVLDGTDPETTGINIMDASGRDPDVVADSLLAVFAKLFDGGYGVRTEEMLSASLRSMLRAGTEEHPFTLPEILRLWTDPVFRRPIVRAVQDDPGLAAHWAWYDGLPARQQENIIAAPANRLRRLLSHRSVVRLLAQRRPGFRIRDAFRDRAIVYVPLNDALLGPITAATIGAAITSELWMAAQERPALEKDFAKHPALVVIDEADRLVAMPAGDTLADALARARSSAVGYLLGLQYLGQVPEAMRKALSVNARTKLIFTQDSDEEARAAAKLSGGELSEKDYLALGRYEIFLRAVANGTPTSWALAKTLPPGKPISDPEQVCRLSKKNHPATPDKEPAAVLPAVQTDAADAADASDDEQVGRLWEDEA